MFGDGMLHGSLRLFFGNNVEVENAATEVSIYSCPVLAAGDCSYCKYIQNTTQLGCTLCHGRCEFSSFCNKSNPRLPETCPPPMITQVSIVL